MAVAALPPLEPYFDGLLARLKVEWLYVGVLSLPVATPVLLVLDAATLATDAVVFVNDFDVFWRLKFFHI